MLKRLISTAAAIVIVLSWSSTAQAQESFRPGQIETREGQVLKGLIAYGSASANPAKFQYKAAGDEPVQVFYPLDVRSVSVEGDRFVGAVVDREMSSMDREEMSYSEEPDLKRDTVFLRVVYDGEKSLFQFLGEEGKNQFYVQEGGEYQLLTYKKYLVRVSDGNSVVAEHKPYLEQLEAYLSECPAIIPGIPSMDYSMSSMKQLFDAYYQCVGQESSFRATHEEAKFEWSAKAGASYSLVSVSGGGDALNASLEGVSSVDMAFGVSMEIFFPWVNERISLANDLLYTQYRFQQTTVPESPILPTPTVDLGGSYLQLSSMVRYYYYFGNNWSAFAGAGLGLGYLLQEYNSLTVEGIGYVREDPAIGETRKREFSGNLGIGIGKGPVSLELRGQWGQGMSGTNRIEAPVTRFMALAGYEF
ncbi:MAG: outer membrane beta-barrel protein [bacterium]|nr:outer membrane beta-barrel protein [bacterium]